MRRLELVRARQEVDGQRPRRLAVQPAERVVVLRAELRAAHVLDPDLGGGRGAPDDDVLELLGRDEAAGRGHRVGELLVLGRGRAADRPAGAWRFCSLIDEITSAGVSPSLASLSGWSQTRMP